MQIHAQSTHSVKQLPYYHLAYLAANNYGHQILFNSSTYMFLGLLFVSYLVSKRIFYYVTDGWSQRVLRLCRITFLIIVILACIGIMMGGFVRVKSYTTSYSIEEATRTLRSYADEHNGNLPEAKSWCDALNAKNSHIFTPFDDSNLRPGESGFALNVRVAGKKISELPSDCVVLFETTSLRDGKRWNQCGGPELLTTQYNDGKGCDVSYSDGRTEFVPNEKLHLLNWGQTPDASHQGL